MGQKKKKKTLMDFPVGNAGVEYKDRETEEQGTLKAASRTRCAGDQFAQGTTRYPREPGRW